VAETNLIELDGQKMTLDRYRYELARSQESVLNNVNKVVVAQGQVLANVGQAFNQADYGGYLRTVVPQLIDTYGQVNATAAVQYYDQMRDAWWVDKARGNPSKQFRQNQARRATNYASARLQSELAAEKGYFAKYADDYELAKKSENVIGHAMKVRQRSGHEASVVALNNAATREVAMYHRDTVLFNSGLDPSVKKVQRVAQASACEFCRMMAIGSTNGDVRVSDYAVKFHDFCNCTINPIYEGQSPIRPDYYDKFEAEYIAASRDGTRSSKTVLSNWRKDLKASAVPTPSNKLADFRNISSLDAKEGFAKAQEMYENRDFAGFTAKITSTGIGKNVSISGKILDASGNQVGKFDRAFYPDLGTVYHAYLKLDDSAKGKGFGTAFSKYSEQLYKENGYKQIELLAALEDGAYTWAKAGYTWKDKNYFDQDFTLNLKNKGVRLNKLGFKGEAKRVRDLVKKLENTPVKDPSYPQPFEIANMEGPEIEGMPFAKWVLSNTRLRAMKAL
jgi:hypothetical protein